MKTEIRISTPAKPALTRSPDGTGWTVTAEAPHRPVARTRLLWVRTFDSEGLALDAKGMLLGNRGRLSVG